jgi:hypothetical protein
MKGATVDAESRRISASVLEINSMGVVECWLMDFRCHHDLQHSSDLMISPKEKMEKLRGNDLEKTIGKMLEDSYLRKRFRIFFNNEFYPALIPVQNKMVLLHKAVDSLVERGALSEADREIIAVSERLAADWFINSD